jgi:hypothetical protein
MNALPLHLFIRHQQRPFAQMDEKNDLSQGPEHVKNNTSKQAWLIGGPNRMRKRGYF